MRRRSSSESPKGAASWMNTYGDMITLLLTFFVLLYSFSSIDAEKWQSLVESLSGEARRVVQQSEEGMVIDEVEAGLDADSFEELKIQLMEFQKLYEKIKEYVDENNLSTSVTLSKTDSEIQIRFVDNVLFDSGSADLKPNAIEILSKITYVLKNYKRSIGIIRIEGHTDNVAINTLKFPTNWELSTARAVEVLRYLIEQQQMDPKIVSAVGYGEYHAIADNNEPEGRAKNRRVDFVIVRTVK